MNIYAKNGDKIVFSNPDAGYKPHQTTAKEHLESGGIYTVEKTLVSNWHTDVYVKELPGIAFNSVLFEDMTP